MSLLAATACFICNASTFYATNKQLPQSNVKAVQGAERLAKTDPPPGPLPVPDAPIPEPYKPPPRPLPRPIPALNLLHAPKK